MEHLALERWLDARGLPCRQSDAVRVERDWVDDHGVLLRREWAGVRPTLLKALAEWREEDHPRDDTGKFTSLGGAGVDAHRAASQRLSKAAFVKQLRDEGKLPADASWDAIAKLQDAKQPYDELLAALTKAEKEWGRAVTYQVAMGGLTRKEAEAMDWYMSGGDPKTLGALPEEMYHVTGAKDAVLASGKLKSRDELGQQKGAGLGGGADDTISFTPSREVALAIKDAMLEARAVASGEQPMQSLLDAAKSGAGATKPYFDEVMKSFSNRYEPGGPLPDIVQAALTGERNGEKLSFEKLADVRLNVYKSLAYWRMHSGGKMDPLFFLSDAAAIARMKPDQVAVVKVRSKKGAQGYSLSGLQEWRTWTGDAVDIDPETFAEWDPEKHPRDEQGRFTSVGAAAADAVGRGIGRAAFEKELKASGHLTHLWGDMEGLDDDAHTRAVDAIREAGRAWEASARHALALGTLSPEQAGKMGVYDADKWAPLPAELYHVTTDLPGVMEHGLKSRDELKQQQGMGLGGGESDTISFTTDPEVARAILGGLRDAQKVASGELTIKDMLAAAERGDGATRPWIADIERNGTGMAVGDGVALLREGRESVDGSELRKRGLYAGDSMGIPESAIATIPGAKPHGEGWQGRDERFYHRVTIPLTPAREREHAVDLFKSWLFWREQAGGPTDPLFFLTDWESLGKQDAKKFGVVKARPKKGAQGYKQSALGEWRTTTGAAVDVDPVQLAEWRAFGEIQVEGYTRQGPNGPVEVEAHTRGGGARPARTKGGFTPTTAEAFIARRNATTRPGFLSPLEPGDLAHHKLFLSPDEKVGFALDAHGDIQNVFNNGGPPGAGRVALLDAVDQGGRTLDCFDGYLPELYTQAGFVETGRMAFNRDYAPEGWDYERDDDPDVVFMAWKGFDGGREAAEERIADRSKWTERVESDRYYDDYDAAKLDARGAARAGAGGADEGMGVGGTPRVSDSGGGAADRGRPGAGEVARPTAKEVKVEAGTEQVAATLGVSLDDVTAMFARPEAIVELRPAVSGDEIRVEVHAETEDGNQYIMDRSIGRDARGTLYVTNHNFWTDKTGGGFGTDVLAQEVEWASKLGARYITTHAVGIGKPGDQGFNGAYTWPRLGFDAAFIPPQFADVPPEVEKAQLVSDLMRTPVGRAWWKENGWSMRMRFDLDPDSRSRKVLDAYLAERAARRQKLAAAERPEQVDLDAEDEALLDRIWDELGDDATVDDTLHDDAE